MVKKIVTGHLSHQRCHLQVNRYAIFMKKVRRVTNIVRNRGSLSNRKNQGHLETVGVPRRMIVLAS